jgi:hypothetical protein
MSLQRSLIAHDHRPILDRLPSRIRFATGTTVNVVPAKHAHYGWTGNEGVILQAQFVGPAGIDYINPADDPRKK